MSPAVYDPPYTGDLNTVPVDGDIDGNGAADAVDVQLVIGAALGMLLLSMLEQGLVLMGVPNEVFRGIVGVMVIASVVFNTYLKR